MHIGVSANFPWFGPKFTELALHIEALKFESVWTGEHIVIPVEIADPHRYGVALPTNYKHMPDPFVSMAAAAAVTSTLRFGMDVCLVTQRSTLVLAKAAATLDQISEGRLIIGIGYGWIREESEIFNVAWDSRVRRSTEVVRALKTIWAEDMPSFSGEFINFPAVYSYPKPLRTGGVPLLIGSGGAGLDNRRALRRVAEIGDGWVPSMLSPEEMRRDLAYLRELCVEYGRNFAELDITLIMPAIAFGLGERPQWAQELPTYDRDETLASYGEMGVTRLIIGMDDMVDDRAFGAIETVSRGFDLI